MSLKLVSAATESAVSIADLKAHLVQTLDEASQDADLQAKLDAAQSHVENETARALITSTWDFSLECWPCAPYIDIPLGNLQTVASVKYTDAAGVQRTMDTADYKVSRNYAAGAYDTGCGRVVLSYMRLWPQAVLDTGEPIVIRFTCGWADAASVPAPIKQAILMLAAHWFRNRDAVVVGNFNAISSEMAIGVARLLAPYTVRAW